MSSHLAKRLFLDAAASLDGAHGKILKWALYDVMKLFQCSLWCNYYKTKKPANGLRPSASCIAKQTYCTSDSNFMSEWIEMVLRSKRFHQASFILAFPRMNCSSLSMNQQLTKLMLITCRIVVRCWSEKCSIVNIQISVLCILSRIIQIEI
jgi:hypothetical protein